MSSITQLGNKLYTGEVSVNFIGRKTIWYLTSTAVIVLAVVATILRGGFTFGIEFREAPNFRFLTHHRQAFQLLKTLFTKLSAQTPEPR